MRDVRRIMSWCTSRTSPSRHSATARSAKSTMTAPYAATCSRWNAGWQRRRSRSQKSPSLVSRPLRYVAPEKRVLDEVALVRDEDVLDQVRIVEEKGGHVEQTQCDDVAIVAGAASQEADQILAERRQVAEEELPFGAGRARTGSHLHDLTSRNRK